MEKALEIMTEYILERCTSLETRCRQLEHENKSLKEQSECLISINLKYADEKKELKKIIEPEVKWHDGKPSSIWIYSGNVDKVCEILGIEEHDKATL